MIQTSSPEEGKSKRPLFGDGIPTDKALGGGVTATLAAFAQPEIIGSVSTVAKINSRQMRETVVIFFICSFFPPRWLRLRFWFLPGLRQFALSKYIATHHHPWFEDEWLPLASSLWVIHPSSPC